MAVSIIASGITAARLLADIKLEITNNTIRTWKFNPSTGFIHSTKNKEWDKGAYLEVVTSANLQELLLHYKIESGKSAPIGTYGVLNGRFAEMIMNHCKGKYSNITLLDLR